MGRDFICRGPGGLYSDASLVGGIEMHSIQTAAEQLHDAVTELLLSLMDAEDDRHPETGQMYPTCAQAWLAVQEYRKATGVYEGAISPQILLEALEGVEQEEK